MATISELRSKAAELRKIADKLDAAASALLELGGSTDNGAAEKVARMQGVPPPLGLGELSGVQAIRRVLKDAGEPLKKAQILHGLQTRGKAIGKGTLESYLSREKK